MFDEPVPDFHIEKTVEVGGQEMPAENGLARQLLDLEKRLSDLEKDMGPKKEKVQEIKSEREELRDRVQQLGIVQQDLERQLIDGRQAYKDIGRQAKAIRAQLLEELETEKRKEQLEQNRIQFASFIRDKAYAPRIMKHQEEGAFILATNQRCILGDRRGAGKTMTTLASWDMNKSQKILCLVPDDVVDSFAHEVYRWAPHRQVMLVGKMSKAEREFAFTLARNMEQFVMVMNYSAWRKDSSLLDSLISLKFDTLVCDEAHHLKNTSTNAYKGVKKVLFAENQCPNCGADLKHKTTNDGRRNYATCAASCGWNELEETNAEWFNKCSIKMVTPMTGTVILNRPQDLYALLTLVDPVVFESEIDFLRAFCYQSPRTGKWTFREGGFDRLKKQLAGRFISRKGAPTPGFNVIEHNIPFDRERYPGQWKVIKQMTDYATIVLESGQALTIPAVIALITRKRQANVWPAGIEVRHPKTKEVLFSVADDVNESIKLDKIIAKNGGGDFDGLLPDLTDDGNMETGANVVVFSQFKGPLKELERRCKEAGIKAVRYDGDTPNREHIVIKKDFDRTYCEAPGYEKKWQVILCNYRTGGEGLNFTAATETIILDEEWNPGKIDQAYGRTDRIGQVQKTNVHVLRIPGTIDTWMMNLIKEKEDMINGFDEATADIASDLLTAIKNGEVM